jgi:hypothetical protein
VADVLAARLGVGAGVVHGVEDHRVHEHLQGGYGLGRQSFGGRMLRILLLPAVEAHRSVIGNPGRITFYNNKRRPRRALGQAGPLRPLPVNVIDLDHFRFARRDRFGGILHEYHVVA